MSSSRWRAWGCLSARQRKPIVTNDYAVANPLKNGCPVGHMPIVRHMSVPAMAIVLLRWRVSEASSNPMTTQTCDN